MSELDASGNPEDIELLPAENSKGPAKRGRRPGEGGKAESKLNRDIRETIKHAFYAAGGKKYLVGVAHRRPDVFLALVGKVVPTETRVSVLASYQGIPVQVEDRDSVLPAIEAAAGSYAVLEANEPLTLATDAATDDDWLTVSSP